MPKSLYVINLAGEKEPFSPQKVYHSAQRAGASKNLARRIAVIVSKEVYPGVKTATIFKRIRALLKQEVPSAALKFSLKEALRKLGPSGFPFEKYVGSILARNGYQVELNQMIKGQCVDYEIDFLARRDKTIFIGECKYHHLPGGKVDLKVALANYARFLDLLQGKTLEKKEYKGFKFKSILLTNTKFTTQAIAYSKCVGVELLGWHQPPGKGLEYFIENQKLYPLTILPSLKNFLLPIFAERGLMLVEDILKLDAGDFAAKTGTPLNIILNLIREAKTLMFNNQR